MRLSTENDTFNGTLDESKTTGISSFSWAWFIRNILLLLVGVIGVAGNALIIAIIMRYKTLRKKEESIHIIGFLAVLDGLTAIGSVIIAINWLHMQLSNVTSYTRGRCLGMFAVVGMGLLSSQVMIACIGLDRCRAVRNPINHLGRNHYKFALYSFIFSAGFGVLAVVFMHVGVDLNSQPLACNIAASVSNVYRAFIGLFSLSISISVIILYAVMLVTMRKNSGLASGGQAAEAAKLQRQTQVTKTVTIILGVYCVCWMAPTYLFTILNVLRVRDSVLVVVSTLTVVGAAVSAASNVFIYSFKMPSIKAYIDKFYKGVKDNVVSSHNSQAKVTSNVLNSSKRNVMHS